MSAPDVTHAEPAKLPKMSYLKAANITDEAPKIDQIYRWTATMPASKLPEYTKWVALGRHTPGYSQFAPKYNFTGKFAAELVEEYGSPAACMNRSLEASFGCRGAAGWSIFCRGDHMNSIMQELRLAYLRLQTQGEDMALIDIWVDNLLSKLKEIYEGPDHDPALRVPAASYSASGRFLTPSAKSPRRLQTGTAVIDLVSPSPIKDKKTPTKPKLPAGTISVSSAITAPPISLQQTKISLKAGKPKKIAIHKGKKRAAPPPDTESETEASDNDPHPTPSKRPTKKAATFKLAVSASTDSVLDKAPPVVLLYFEEPTAVPDHDNHPLTKRYKCRHCPRSFLADSASNLTKHRAVCPGSLAATRDKAPGALPPIFTSDQSTLKSTSGRVKLSFAPSGFNNALADWIATDARPFAIVESEKLSAVVKFLDPDAYLPCHTTIWRRIMDQYKLGSEKVILQLKTAPGVIHYAFDIWTTPSRTAAILGVIGYYCNEDLKQCILLLDLVILKGRHTGAKLGDALYHLFQRLGIQTRIGPGTGDNASNNLTAMQQLSERLVEEHEILVNHRDLVGCITHIANLGAQKLLKSEGTLSVDDYPAQSDPNLPSFSLSDFDCDREKILGEPHEVAFAFGFGLPSDADPADEARGDDEANDSDIEGEEYDPELDEHLATVAQSQPGLTTKQRRARYDASPIGMVHAIARFIGYSPQRLEGFRTLAEDARATLLTVCPTRWDSMCLAAKRVIQHEKAVIAFCKKPKYAKAKNCPPITKDTIAALREIVPLLGLFQRLTKKYSKNDILAHDYLSDLHYTITSLRDKAKTLAPARKTGCLEASALLEKYIRIGIQNNWLCAAFALDPFVRRSGLSELLDAYGESDRLVDIEAFINLRVQMHATITEVPSSSQAGLPSSQDIPPSPGSESGSPLKPFSTQPTASTRTTAASELWASYSERDAIFASVAVGHRKESTIAYWRRLTKAQPHIRPMCRFVIDVLGLPVSSVAVERLFSDAGNVAGRRRGSLTPTSLVAQTAVRVWQKQGLKLFE